MKAARDETRVSLPSGDLTGRLLPPTPVVMPGAKCTHKAVEVHAVDKQLVGLTRRCVKKFGHAGNHTMETAGTVPVDERADGGVLPPSATPPIGSPPPYVIPLNPPSHTRSALQDAAAALEVAAKAGRFAGMRFVLSVDERRLAAQLHDAIVARVGFTALAVGELAPATEGDPS